MSKGWPKGKPRGKTWIKGLTKETDARVQRLSEKLQGRKFSEATREKMRENALQPEAIAKAIRNLPNPMRGKENPFYGKHHTKETKDRLKEASRQQFSAKGAREKHSKVMTQVLNNPNTKQKMSIKASARIGERNPFYGRHHSDRTKELLRQATISQYSNPETLRKMQEGYSRRPTKPERMLLALIIKYRLPFKYVGDMRFITEGIILNPDFLGTKDKAKVIECFGDYWHSPKVVRSDWKNTDLGKMMAYNSIGYKCLVLWENEIYNIAEEELACRITGFARGK